MTHNVNSNDEGKSLANLSSEQIEGSNILGGGSNSGNLDMGSVSNIEPHLIPPGNDEIGYDTGVIAFENPSNGGLGNTLNDAPPLNDHNFTAFSGFENGNS